MQRTRAKLEEKASSEERSTYQFFDSWYMDDGQLFCRPEDVQDILSALDEELGRVGATRGEGNDVKSIARIIGPETAMATISAEWSDGNVARTCKRPPANSDAHVLGIDLEANPASQFDETSSKIDEIHRAIHELQDPGIELVLLRNCADVCKITHLLRAKGHQIPEQSLHIFDKMIRECLEKIVCGRLYDEAYMQSTMGVAESGLGLRRSVDLSLPAAIASRVQARPAIRELLTSEFARIFPRGLIERYDAGLDEMVIKFKNNLSATAAAQAQQIIDDSSLELEEKFIDLKNGRPPPRQSPSESNFLIDAVGAEDPERPGGPPHLQHELSRILDEDRLDSLSSSLAETGLWKDIRRIKKLRDPSVSHDWLWLLNSAHGADPAAEFAIC